MKRLLRIGVSLLGCIMISQLGGGDVFVDDVYAADPTTTPTTTTTPPTEDDASKTELSIVIWLETILRVIYLIMRPLLALAGAAMDNSLVYGKIFNFTPALWKFWTIMRNFANFALGFLFLWAIFKTIFTQGSTADLFSALKKLVLGAILVQISWFALSVLIDLSTVATVAIGGLPLYAVKGDTDYKKIRFLKPHGIFQMDKTANKLATESAHTVFYSCANDEGDTPFYLPCSVDNNFLAYDGNPADVESRKSRKEGFISSRGTTTIDHKGKQLTLKDHINDNFCVYGNSLITNDYGAMQISAYILQQYRDAGVAHMQGNGSNMCLTFEDIISKANNSSGPLFTLYASILNTSELALSTNHKNIADLSLEFLMRTVMSLLLFVPLLVFAVIMIMRVGYLRLIIAASPILVLMFVNDKKAPGGGVVEKVANLSNILSLIFLPVIGTFAISLSVVFLSLIQRANFMRSVSLSELFGLETEVSKDDPNMKCYNLKITTLCFNESQRNAGNNITDTFGYLLINGFGLVLMRTVVFAALKSSEITKGTVETIKGLGETVLGAIPIIPTGTGKGLSYSGLGKVKDGIASIPSKISAQQSNALEDEIRKITNSSSIKATESGLAQTLQATSSADVAKNTVISSKAEQGTDHTDYPSFFAALSKGGGSSTVYDNFGSAFADEKNYKSYGMKNMDEILKNWNGSVEGGTRQNYIKQQGTDMIKALDTLSQKSGSSVKKVMAGSTPYYIDPSQSTMAHYEKENGFIISNFTHENTSGDFFSNKTAAEEFINHSNTFGILGMRSANLFPRTLEALDKSVGSGVSVKIGSDISVNVEGANNIATSITKKLD